jgi:hypothetical protein
VSLTPVLLRRPAITERFPATAQGDRRPATVFFTVRRPAANLACSVGRLVRWHGLEIESPRDVSL